mgnify:CR=1
MFNVVVLYHGVLCVKQTRQGADEGQRFAVIYVVPCAVNLYRPLL